MRKDSDVPKFSWDEARKAQSGQTVAVWNEEAGSFCGNDSQNTSWR